MAMKLANRKIILRDLSGKETIQVKITRSRTVYSLTEYIGRSILLGTYTSQSELAMFTAYFDVSGTKNARLLTMAGYVSNAKKWKKFEQRWKEIIDREGVKQFHMTDCVSFAGEFANWREHPDRRKRLINELLDCARKYTNKRFSATVIMEDYNRVDSEYKLHEYYGYPYSLCATSCIEHVRTWAKNRKIRDRITYVFEDGDERRGNFPKFCRERIRR